jgi:Double zinc ribbon
MSLGSALIGMGLLLVVILAVTMPWRRGSDDGEWPVGTVERCANSLTTPSGNIEAARNEAYAALVDLDFDHSIGKLNDDDYHTVRVRLMSQAVAALQQLDQAPSAAERQLEGLIEARRRMIARSASQSRIAGARSCSACGAPLGVDVRFCGKCGSPVGMGCPHCGAGIQQSDGFCVHCGRHVVQGAIPAPN